MIVNEENYDMLQKVSKKTMTDYGIKWFNAENIEGYIEPDAMYSMIEDLFCEIERLEEKIENIEQDKRDNYKQITPSEMYD